MIGETSLSEKWDTIYLKLHRDFFRGCFNTLADRFGYDWLLAMSNLTQNSEAELGQYRTLRAHYTSNRALAYGLVIRQLSLEIR